MSTLSHLNRHFQKKDLHPGDVLPKVKATISLIQDKYVLPPINPNYGPKLEEIYHRIEHNQNKLGEHELSMRHDDHTLLHNDITIFSTKVISNLNARFPDESLYKCFNTLFNSKVYPTDRHQLVGYGNDELLQLINYYSQLLLSSSESEENPESTNYLLTSEWELFKYIIYENHRDDDLKNICQCVLSGYREDYPTIAKLAGICMVLPASSVECERGFSQQNLIKTKQRNQLESPHLDMLMRLKIEGPDFPFSKAVSAWKKKAKRLYI